MIRREIKHRMMSGIDPEELITIRLSISEAGSEINWEKKHEFEYKGEMYDVVYHSITKDSVVYRCWWDHEETELNLKLNTLLVGSWQNDRNRQEKQELCNDVYRSLFIPDKKDICFPISINNYCTFRLLIKSDKCIELIAPPPELA